MGREKVAFYTLNQTSAGFPARPILGLVLMVKSQEKSLVSTSVSVILNIRICPQNGGQIVVINEKNKQKKAEKTLLRQSRAEQEDEHI
ncbi:MAG: hypothetical protein AAB869_03355, partial [Patescibacteria group bacterium]